jgi:hypothetical protein
MNLRESIRRILKEESKKHLFVRRRFTQEELDRLMNNITTSVSNGHDFEDEIYNQIRVLLNDKKPKDLDDESQYWSRYVKYEMTLGNYIRSKFLFPEQFN